MTTGHGSMWGVKSGMFGLMQQIQLELRLLNNLILVRIGWSISEFTVQFAHQSVHSLSHLFRAI